MKALKVEGLVKKFGGLHALKEISLSLEIGEHVALIGPNGAGKSTLLNLISGELSPTAGRIHFLGEEVTTMPTYRRIHLGLARSFQLTSLLPQLSVINNMMLALHGTKPSRFRMFRRFSAYDNILGEARKLLESIDLCDKAENIVESLSYGDQRKLEVALSLALQPKLLLLDEPSAGLTADESAGVIDMIRNLASDVTVLMVAHDMDLVFEVSDRIIVLHHGQIIAEGTPEKIEADPRVREVYMGLEESIGSVRDN